MQYATQELREYILNELPQGGKWINEDDCNAFMLLADVLYDYGCPEGSIKSHLQDVYNAAATQEGYFYD